MVFTWAGRTYDTTQMRVWSVAGYYRPLIYATEDWQHVFVATFYGEGISVNRAEAAEILSLADRFGIPELLNALPPNR